VDNISFAVKKGEVFGLLGVNGAGKTTTFKMLAGEITSTAGDSYFNGLKISDNLDKVREGLGYCPQFDALIENLTVKEQLEMFYDMKSLDARFKEQAIARKIEEMNLGEYTDKLSGTLSGGNKRKLSVAMAMIGNPRIIFLDEPSTGMDPKARRFMWKVISRVATEKKNATVILTTHSMEEAEALSTRLGIMVKGNFKCIGTPQHIKSKYGEGFEIEVKLNALPKSRIEAAMQALNLGSRRIIKENEFEAVLEFLKVGAEDRLEISEGGSGNYIYNSLKAGKKEVETFTLVEFLEICRLEREVLESIAKEFGSIEVLERLQTFMRLKIKDRVRVGRLFDFFEKSKDRLAVQQYTIKQATVEQIFNKFAGEGELSEYNG
jgi:ATP-binding cassette subfamily A (ABC1) protein 3